MSGHDVRDGFDRPSLGELVADLIDRVRDLEQQLADHAQHIQALILAQALRQERDA